MKLAAATLVALSLLAGAAQARTVDGYFTDLGRTAPRGVFETLNETAPRSLFDSLNETAPRSPFEEIRDSAPRSGGDGAAPTDLVGE